MFTSADATTLRDTFRELIKASRHSTHQRIAAMETAAMQVARLEREQLAELNRIAAEEERNRIALRNVHEELEKQRLENDRVQRERAEWEKRIIEQQRADAWFAAGRTGFGRW